MHPFFQNFMLSPKDFDSAGDFTYPKKDQCDLQHRAGIFYFQPVHCLGLGIAVLNLYDQGDNNWLAMN